jgi:D-3-phosphoglycerate dehydrogenase
MNEVLGLYAIPTAERSAILKSVEGLVSAEYYDNPLSEENINPHTTLLAILPSTVIDDKLLKKLPRLRAVISLSAGLDHIRLQEANRSFKLINNPTFSVPSVSEYVVSCIFKAYTEMYWQDPLVQRGEISGKKALIIGYGNIGKVVASKLAALGLDIQVFTSVSLNPADARLGIKKCHNLAQGAKWADLLSVNTSLRPDTLNLIDDSVLEVMHDGSVLINAARGGIVSNAALLRAVNRTRFMRVFLDDINDIESETAQDIISNDAVTYTQHTAWNTDKSVERRITYTVQQIKSLLEDR